MNATMPVIIKSKIKKKQTTKFACKKAHVISEQRLWLKVK